MAVRDVGWMGWMLESGQWRIDCCLRTRRSPSADPFVSSLLFIYAPLSNAAVSAVDDVPVSSDAVTTRNSIIQNRRQNKTPNVVEIAHCCIRVSP